MFDGLFFAVSCSTKLISFASVMLVEKMPASLHDVEEATAQAFKIIVDEKVSVFCKLFV